VAENFDSGPLSWVKDQINQLLESVLVNVSAVQANMHDTSPMRLSQTSLYQATGALDMVGLEGCKRFSSELEKLASKLEKKTVNATPELIEAFEKAVKTLQSYLQELLNGSPDIPLRLYSVLNPIVTAQGETLDESEMFFPDTSNSAPKSVPSKELSEAEYASFIVEQRVTYQKSLLNWLQTKQASAVESMTMAVSNVSQAQQKNSNKTLWWAASAFTESLAQKEISENQGAKKLCRKLDQELKLFADGVSKPHNNLLRDILYYVAISDVDKASVLQVKEVFELDQFIDKKSSANFIGTSIDANETALVEQLIEELEVLRDLWDEISNTLNFSKIDSKTSTSPVHIDNVLITKFSDAIGTSQAISENLSQVLFVDFYSVLQQASNTLRDDASKVNHAALIEVAAALNLIQSALNSYSDLDPEQIQKLHSELLRLESISSGEVYDKLENDRAGELDRDTVKAVVAHIHESLKVVEQALDSYFRNPTEKAQLTLTPQPIKQVSAVFDMLGLPTPTAIANASSQYIQYFQRDSYVVNQADFELVAESLSMLGLYADEMPKTRPESEKALEGALQRLNTALVNAGVMTAKAPVETATPVEKVKTKTKKTSKISTKAPVIIEDVVEQLVEAAPIEATSEVADGPTITDKAFDPELLDIYLEEAEEVLAHIAQNCQALRVNVTDNDALVEVRRSFHTLKGSGRTVGLNALGEVAGQVEFFLNGVLDKKVTLNLKQVSSIEQVAAAFAGWTAELRANNQVAVSQEAWLVRIADLPNQDVAAQAEVIQIKAKTEKTKAKTPKKLEAQILIGGTRKMSRAFYDIFMLESGQNVTILEQDVAKVNADRTLPPSKAALHANHTLASNALAAEFTPMGELSRALEQWLDETQTIWAGQHVVLYTNTVKVLSGMWQKISEQNNPRSANALIKVLAEATLQARQHQELAVELPSTEETAQTQDITEVVPAAIEELPVVEEMAAAAIDEVAVIEEPAIEESNLADFEVKLITQGKRFKSDADTGAAAFGSALDSSKVDQELLTMFIEEAREIMPEVGADLRAWRADPKQMKHPDSLQRALHTLKGSARMAGQVALGDAVHELEDEVIRSLKRKNAEINFESMFVELDKIGSYFEQTMVETPKDTISQIQAVDAPPSGRTTDRNAQFLRMRADTLDRLINEAGEISIIRSRLDRELTGFKQSSHDLTDSLTRLRGYLRELEIEAETQLQSRMSILQEANETFDPLEFDRFTRLQELTRMIAESVNDVGTIQNSLIANLDQSEAALQQQNRMNRDLQQNLLGVRMMPFKQISERMQRIVRQTARELKKSVNLVIDGESTDIDRSVLDKLGAPLEHLLRNAVAHGIEMPAERKKKNKPDTGTITLKIRQENDEIQIAVSDDGAGIDLARVKEKAIKNKLIDAKADVSDQALMSVIFETGFSTADKVSQISGRGVGLDVVRNDISGLGGRVELSSEFGKGTLFNVNLPVTLSVAQVLVVRSGTANYALPVGIIEQAQKIKRQVLVDAYKDGHITWADKQYAMHYIGTLLGQQEQRPEDHAYNSVLLLRVGSFNIALHVDEVIGNQEAVMKPIGAQLARVPGIVGATVTGDGSVMLIINPVQLVARAILTIGTSSAVVAERTSLENVLTKYRVMVVDDSLTMRKVLSRLLEREGFEVIVAKDGIDAMQTLLDVTPDAILTDIEMPRMDGFALARNIRDDARTAKTPLIMISSRTADKHQNLAKEIGVDAFFGKPVQESELVSKVMELLTSNRQLH
jgi:chemosensory pili system protein ChpA (sensor histidine kinase/response regulator)